jgi:hypothetical protein
MFEPTVPNPARISAIHTIHRAELAEQRAPIARVKGRSTSALAHLGGLLITLGQKLQTHAAPKIRNHSTT